MLSQHAALPSCVDHPVVEEIFDLLQAQPLYIHRAAADEMAQPLDALRGEDQPAGAADIDFAFPGHRIRSAIGAVRREGPGCALLVARERKSTRLNSSH